jgi:RNA polymerase sigma-70 factor, ECF subfamily
MNSLLISFNQHQRHPSEENLIALLESCQAAVFNICYQVLRHQHDTDDATQVVLCKITDGFHKMRDACHFQRWVYRVAMNTALDLRRKNMRLSTRQQPYDESLTNIASEPATNEVVEVVHEQLGRLDDESQVLLIRHYFEKETLNELAEEAGVTTSAIWQKIQKAQEKLRRYLSQAGYAQYVPLILPYLESVKTVKSSTTALSSAVLAKVHSAAVAGGGTVGIIAATTLGIGEIIMKTKIITITLVALALCGTGAYLGVKMFYSTSQRSSSAVIQNNPTPKVSQTNPGNSASLLSTGDTKETPAVSTQPEKEDFPKFASQAQLDATITQVMMITDENERLQAIRKRLGMKISDEVYRTALAQYGNRSSVKELFRSILTAWSDADPKASILWALQFPFKGMKGFSIAMFEPWAQKDKEAALAFAREQLNEEQLRVLEKFLAQRSNEPLPTGDFVSRLKHADNEKEDSKWYGAISAILYDWVRKDPKGAAEYALTISKERFNGTTRTMVLSSVTREWSNSDPDAALAWAKSLQDEKERSSAISEALPGWARKHPEQALDLSGLPRPNQLQVLSSVAADWAAKNPVSAAEFAQNLTDEELKFFAINAVAGTWGKKDPDNAAQWACNLPVGKLRDNGLSGVACAISKYDLGKAEKLMDGIQDDELRRTTIRHLVTFGGKNDLANASRIAEKIGQIPSFELVSMVLAWGKMDSKDSKLVRAWVEKLQSQGKIQYLTYPKTETTADPVAAKKWEQDAAENGYKSILGTISNNQK